MNLSNTEATNISRKERRDFYRRVRKEYRDVKGTVICTTSEINEMSTKIPL